MRAILTGHVLYSYESELLERDSLSGLAALFSGIRPFHAHEGTITLTASDLILAGDENLQLPLGTIEQVYLGFDEAFPRTLVKNMGLFWQPLRLSLSDANKLYLIIDYSMIGTNNQLWFNGLKEILGQR